MDGSESKLCPSSTCAEGAMLLGIVQEDQIVVMVGSPLMVDAAFVEKVTEMGEPEKRFRFAGKCIKSGCSQWSGSSCGVVDLLLQVNEHIRADGELKRCIIRPECRWYAQQGADACAICTYVITDNMHPMPEMGQ